MIDITLALDWTPNTNHAGIYTALERGWYQEAGIRLSLLVPDGEGRPPTSKNGAYLPMADLTICTPEALIGHHTRGDGRDRYKAVAALLQGDISAIVSLKKSGVSRPADLDSRTYASFGSAFEDHIVKRMIQLDGGKGELNIERPPKLTIWDTVVAGKADAAWVFLPWEGAAAERAHVDLNAFRLSDFGIPYGYSPLICASPSFLHTSPDAIRAFLRATARGYRLAAEDPDEAAGLLMEGARHPSHSDWGFLLGSQRRLAGHILNEDGEWGTMRFDRWRAFTEWLEGEGLLINNASGTTPQNGDNWTQGLFSCDFL